MTRDQGSIRPTSGQMMDGVNAANSPSGYSRRFRDGAKSGSPPTPKRRIRHFALIRPTIVR